MILRLLRVAACAVVGASCLGLQSVAAIEGVSVRIGMLASERTHDEAAGVQVVRPVRRPGDLWFYEKRSTAHQPFTLCMRRGDTGEERVLVDPEAWRRRSGQVHVLKYFVPSPDGRLLAYGLAAAGSDDVVLHLMDTHTRQPVGKPVERVALGGVSWAADGRSLVFNRLQAGRKGMSVAQKHQRSRVVRMVPGQLPGSALFGLGVFGMAMKPTEMPFVQLTHDGRWAIGTVLTSGQRDMMIYVAALDDDEGPSLRWKKLVDISTKGAPNGRLLRARLDMGLASAQVLLPAGDSVLGGVGVAADAVYVEVRDGDARRLMKLDPGAEPTTPSEIELPIEGLFSLGGSAWRATDARLPGAVLEVGSGLLARQIFTVTVDGRVLNTGLQPLAPTETPQEVPPKS
jgi:prolyl oligopeptidase